MSNHPKNNLPIIGLSFTSDGKISSASADANGLSPRSATSDDRSVGEKIKKLRREAGLTQKELAEMVGVTGAQFHRYEAGTTRVAASRLMGIAAALGVPAEALIGGGGEPAPPRLAPSLHGEATDELVELVEAYSSIADPRRRSALVSFARVLAANGAVYKNAPDDGS